MQQVRIKEKPFDAPTVGDGEFPKPISFSRQKKKRFLNAKEKEALMALLGSARKRHGGLHLYAHGVDRPRPLRPAPVEQRKVLLLSSRRLLCGPSGAWVRDAPEWKAVRSYPAKMLCCWAKVSTVAAVHLPPLHWRRDNVSRRC